MDTVKHLSELFAYNDWANRSSIVAVRERPHGRSLRILAHLLITEREYFERLSGKDSTGFDFWPELDADQCGRLNAENSERFYELLDRSSDADLDAEASYCTSEGVTHTNTFRELLTHVLMHSATHRGNIVSQMRAADLEPPKIDYIIYLRRTR